MNTVRYPIAVQDFGRISRNGSLYVDKTEGVYELINRESQSSKPPELLMLG